MGKARRNPLLLRLLRLLRLKKGFIYFKPNCFTAAVFFSPILVRLSAA